MEQKSIRLRRGKEQSHERFHPWVFSGAIQEMDGNIEEGDIVRVLSSDGRYLGSGHFQIGSIAVRMLTWGKDDVAIDASF